MLFPPNSFLLPFFFLLLLVFFAVFYAYLHVKLPTLTYFIFQAYGCLFKCDGFIVMHLLWEMLQT